MVIFASRYDCVVCGKAVTNPEGYGVLELEKGLVVRIHEKAEKPLTNLAMLGLFILPKQIFSAIRSTQVSRTGELWPTDSIQILIARGLRIGCLIVDDFWIGPNSKKDLRTARTFLESQFLREVSWREAEANLFHPPNEAPPRHHPKAGQRTLQPEHGKRNLIVEHLCL
jgi:dTDP-glucose pyrophosphorylase